MSRARMIQLQHALEDSGWSISDDDGGENLFSPFDDIITWHLVSNRNGKRKVLIFYLFDYLGRRTDKLSDISHVESEEDNLKLYFDKIKSEEWKLNLRSFVRCLY